MKQYSNQTMNKGFTLMEIIVATTIFAFAASAMMVLFNYTLKINRRSEALRQATQGMRNFVEFLVKEVRNGQVDYFVVNGNVSSVAPIGPCTGPKNNTPTKDVYADKDNKLAIISPEGDEECIFYGKPDGSYVDTVGNPPVTFTAPGPGNYTLVIEKSTGEIQTLNPPNFKIDSLAFMVRPVRDPYTSLYIGIQPSVSIFIKFTVQLPTGEAVPIYYQTSVSTDKYDVPTGS